MRCVLVVVIEDVDTGVIAGVVGTIREAVAASRLRGVGMTAHVHEAADRIMAVVAAERRAH